MSVNIADFLASRLDEDEQAARDASTQGWFFKASGSHLSRWNPNRLLAEVMAKRTIVAMWTPPDYREAASCPDGPCRECADSERDAAIDAVLDMLASVYADHPDFDPAWRPQ